ncbi:MAG: hypothetical protein HY430_01575 [Candidatus Levybacteria bacterium]|nr:hypothetical protein [Candidatus Levybacteria bacterium]
MKYKLNKAVFYTLLGLGVGVLLMKAVDAVQQVDTVKQTNTQANIQTPTKPLGYLTQVETSRGTLYLELQNDYISFNANEVAVNNDVTIKIKREDYPKLFEQGVANSSVLQVKLYKDPNGEEFIELSVNNPDHGGYARAYVLLVNPFTGTIKEGLNDYSKPNE